MTITLQLAKAILKQSSFKDSFNYDAIKNFDELFIACIDKGDRSSINSKNQPMIWTTADIQCQSRHLHEPGTW